MPIVAIPVEMLLSRIGEPPLETEELVTSLKRLGCDVEGYETVERLRCLRCGTLLEAGPDGAPPAACDGCARELREVEGAVKRLGSVDVVKIDLLPVRPDMLDPGGLARALRSFLGRADGPVGYSCDAPALAVEVDPRVADRDGAFRPFIACAVIRGFQLDDSLIPVVMKLQENLHWAMGRDRKLASIGIYDLGSLRGEPFRYRPVEPEELRFVPLMCDPDDPESSMTPRGILEKHPKGVAYAHLLAGRSAYPLLEDGEGTVLSMPPIINSEVTKVHEGTTSLFIDVTGLSERLVSRTLTVTSTSLLELVPAARLEAVEVRYHDRTVVTPSLEPDLVELEPGETARLVGADVDREQVAQLLAKMGHGIRTGGSSAGPLRVEVPPYRNDVMHPVDLIEDVAIAYGYDALTPSLVTSMTVAQPSPVEVLSSTARRALAGLGLLEMKTLPLSSPEATFDALGLPREEGFVAIENPASVEQTMLRTSLLPGLLEALQANIHRELPHRIFEVGDVSRLASDRETGAAEHRHAAVALVGVKVGFADVRSVADALFRELGRELLVVGGSEIEGELWIPGRAARVWAGAERGDPVGIIGEVHPAVLERFGIRAPAALVEVDLGALGAAG